MLNLLALRFANSLFASNWDNRTIDSVQITVAEEVGIEGRWGYFDQAGQMRDMIQNHLLQILTMIAMPPPADLTTDRIRDEKVKVLRSLRRIDQTNVRETTVRGQYTAGFVQWQESAGLSGRGRGEQEQQHRNLRLHPRGYRQLAMGRGAVLPAYR